MRPIADDDAIAAFWTWWANGGADHARTDPTDVDLAQLLTALVRSIHPGLAWHLARRPDDAAAHTLVVGSDGIAASRPAAEAWRRAAPATTDGWEFRTSRDADLEALSNVLRLEDREVDFADMRFSVIDRPDGRHDIAVHHPGFAGLDRELRMRLAFHALDWTLGEDLVGRWVGAIDAPLRMPADALGAAALAARVAEDEAGRDPESWIAVEGILGGRARVWLVREHLDRFDLPALHLHHEIAAKYRAMSNGMPHPSELTRLQREEDAFEALGPGAALVAIVTGGRRRVVHLYSDGSPTAAKEIQDAVRRVRRKATAVSDPGWTALAGLRPRG